MTYKNVTCPYCKSPAFVYTQNEEDMFICHDCKRNVKNSRVEEHVRNQRLNSNDPSGNSRITIKPTIDYGHFLSDCTLLSSLPRDHLCRQYVRDRRIPDRFLSDLLFTNDPTKLYAGASKRYAGPKGPKLVLPFKDEDGKLFGVQLRALDDSQPRYIILMFDEDRSKIFGLDRWNKEEPTLIVEGPIDSLFLENALAMAGTGTDLNKYSINSTMVLDNEPRNKQVIKIYEKYIADGFKIVIWPSHLKDKDVNDMVLSGHDPSKLIIENTYQGMHAKLMFDKWKKI